MFKKLKHWLYLLSATLGIIQGVRPPQLEELPQVGSPPLSSPSPVYNNGDSFPNITLIDFKGRPEEKEYALKGIEYANAIMRSECFMNSLLKANITETNLMSNEQILKFISDRTVKARVEFFTGNWKQNYIWKTVGYETVPFDGWTYVNRHFVKNARDAGSNIIHEVMHTLGFDHLVVKKTSLPYTMNDIYEACFDVVIK